LEELKYRSMFPHAKFKILFNPYRRSFVYALLAPFVYKHLLRRFNVTISRTVQLFGCVLGVLLKLFCNAKFILRQGYQFTKFAKYNGWALTYAIGTILEFIGYWLADYIIVTTELDRRYIIERYKVNPNKIVIIPNWVDAEMFKPMDMPKERGRIIFVGRLEYQKNVLALIDAVKNLPNAKLYIVGDGSLRKAIEEKIKRENIRNVVLMGVIPNEKLPIELNKSEIYVLPSLWEGHPKALLEAMACGLPVIGTDVEGIRELIVNGVNGLLCKPTAKDIRRCIQRLLSDFELRKRLGENARRFIIENFSFEKVMRRELALHLWLIKHYERRRHMKTKMSITTY